MTEAIKARMLAMAEELKTLANSLPSSMSTVVKPEAVKGGVAVPTHVVINSPDAPTFEWPNALNTGPTGVLTPSGSVSSTANNQVIENLDVTGTIIITHTNVTVRNCKVTATGQAQGIYSNVASGASSVIQNCEIVGGTVGIRGQRMLIVDCEIRAFLEDGIKAGTSSWIEDNFIHSPGYNQYGDGVEIAGGSNCLVKHNWIDVRRSGANPFIFSAIYVGTYLGAVSNITVQDNYFDGGDNNVCILNDGNGEPTNVAFTNNRFGQIHQSAYVRNTMTPTWSGNTLLSTGEAVNLGGGGTPGPGPVDPPPPTSGTDWWKTGTNPPTGPRVALTTVASASLSSPGQQLIGRKVNGPVQVSANNCLIRDCEMAYVNINPGVTGTVIEWSRIIGPGDDGIRFAQFTVRNTEITGTVDGMKANGGILVEDCWVHDLYRIGGPAPQTPGVHSHNDGAQALAGSNITFRRSRFENCAYNAGIFVDPDGGNMSNVLIEECYLQCSQIGMYVSWSAQQPGAVVTNLVVRNNIMGAPNTYGPSFAGYALVDLGGASNPGGWTITWENNLKEVRINGGPISYQPCSRSEINTPANQRWRN